MNQKKILTLSMRNMRLNISRTLIVIVGLMTILSISGITVMYRQVLQNRLSDNLSQYISASSITFSVNNSTTDVIEKLSEMDSVLEIQTFAKEEIYYPAWLSEGEELETFVMYDNLQMNAAGCSYHANSRNSTDKLGTNSVALIYSYSPDSDFFSQYEVREFRAKNEDAPMLVFGEFPTDEGQIIIPEEVLRLYGIPQDKWEGLIGSSMSFSLAFEELVEEYAISHNYDPNPIVFEGEISGILSSDTYSIYSRNSVKIYQMMNLSPDQSLVVKVFLKDYSCYDEVSGFLFSEYGIEGNVGSFFEVCNYLDKQIGFADSVFSIVIVAFGLAVFMCFVLLYTYYFEENSRYLGTLKAIGYKPSAIVRICSYEIIVEIVIAGILSYVVSIFSIYKIREQLEGVLGFEVLLDSNIFFSAVITIAIVSVVFLLMVICSAYIAVIRKSAVSLLTYN